MKNILHILISFLLIGCHSTNSLLNKEPYLYTFEKPNGSKMFVKSHKKDNLSSKDFQNLKKYLKKINDYNINFDKKIIINFIDNDPAIYRKNYRVPWDIFYGNLADKLNSIEPCNHFWIINKKVKDLHYYHGNKINWIVDTNNIIRESFFEYDGPNGGFLILKPNGEYFLKLEEYSKLDMISTLKYF